MIHIRNHIHYDGHRHYHAHIHNNHNRINNHSINRNNTSRSSNHRSHNNNSSGFAVANIVVNPTSSTNINTEMAGGTLITTTTYGMASLYSSNANVVGTLSSSILHSPNTTSPVTYNVVFKAHGSGSAYWAINNGFATITAMEIGG